ncbi:hypothetical protein [Desulfonema magnum]|uniref:Uncharacterized protein n=1 Tax=Desulfonema magnum TaxID=45655 RepID=A0A975BPS1_9BACT|nr:hypothetical protein [Desulfonema magnum]QTA88825.1 Uncharacterized protein dnm_048720 [Desulfonema magnum]
MSKKETYKEIMRCFPRKEDRKREIRRLRRLQKMSSDKEVTSKIDEWVSDIRNAERMCR